MMFEHGLLTIAYEYIHTIIFFKTNGFRAKNQYKFIICL